MERGFEHRKGLSTIVSTLLIILLVFVAIGIVWVVVKNLVTGGSSQIDLTSKCLDVSVTPTRVVSSGTVYNVTVQRNSAKSDIELGGVKLIFSSDASDTNFIQDIPGNIDALQVRTFSVDVQDVANPTEVESVVYFIDDSGKEQYCQGGESLSF
jgi:hypothetical protein